METTTKEMIHEILPPQRLRAVILYLFLAVLTPACGDPDGEPAESSQVPAPSALTQEEVENGIGPVTALTLGDLDDEMASTGKAVFEMKCSACHKLDKRYVGPALGDVLDRRSPAFVMNMILNPEQMLAEHPEARKMLADYMTPMANQNLTEVEARSIVEYLRTVDSERN